MNKQTKKQTTKTTKNPSKWDSIVALSKVLVPQNTGVLRHVARAY